MNAPLKVGDRVQMTSEGLRMFKTRTGDDVLLRGVVVTVYPNCEMVKVKREGVKVNESWHWKFWQLEDGQ